MVKGAVVGFGRMGLTHFSILNNHPEVRFVAVCDSSAFILKNISRYIKLETFSDYKRMFDNLDLDFVIIATPPAAHAETIKDAIEHDLNVFVEKPFVLSSQQGQQIVNMLNGRKIVNQVGYVIRFNDVFMQVKRLLETNTIGELLSFKVEMYGPTVLKETKNGWRSKKSQGGGCLYDFSPHSIDLINYLFGLPEQIVGTILKNIYSRDVEDAVYSTLLYKENLSGHLLVNWSDPSYRKPGYRLEVLGRQGKLIADLHAYKLFLKSDPADGKFTRGWNIRYVTDFAEPVRFYVRGNEFTRQLDYFIDCIVKRTPGNMSSFADALVTDLIIERLVENFNERNK